MADHPAQAALRAALDTRGDGRRKSIEAALARWPQGTPGNATTSLARAELGQRDALVASLVDEYAEWRGLRPVPADPVLGAWGLHLVKVFGVADPGVFKDFVVAAHDAADRDTDIILRALRAAQVEPRHDALRKRLATTFHAAVEEWLLGRFGS